MSDQRLAELRELLYREVPLSRNMGVVAESYDGDHLTLTAELAPNINIHGTAFGGSMYSLAALCGWSLLQLRLEDLSLEAEIMLGSARIDYRKPVRSRLVAVGTFDTSGFEAFATRIRNAQRASIDVSVVLAGERSARQASAVFTGSYATVND